jgi:apolipoprotein N-acyltransferase
MPAIPAMFPTRRRDQRGSGDPDGPRGPRHPPGEGGRGEGGGRPAESGRGTRRVRTLARAVLALGAGGALFVAFPPLGWWPLAPVAVAALTLAVRGVRARAAYGLGFLFGLGLFVPLLRFVGFVGADGHLVLSAAEAAILALAAPATAAVVRLRGWWLWVAAAWVGQEALRSRAPFGGFPWGRLAFSQPEGPFAHLAAIGGAPLVTAAVAAVGALLASAVLGAGRLAARARRPGPARAHDAHIRAAAADPDPAAGADADGGVRRRVRPVGWRGPLLAARPVAAPALGALALTLAGLAVGLPTAPQAGTLRVAAVQGDVPGGAAASGGGAFDKGGVDALGEPFQVTANHVAGTERLAADVGEGRIPAPELVLWPENSSDVDPLADGRAAAMLDRAARSVGVPILVGAVLDGPGAGRLRNAGLVWDSSGWTGDIYVKRHPVPFGEYLPFRAVLERLVGRFADEMPNDFVAGGEVGLIRVAGTAVGDVICFEVAYDGIVRDAVAAGAQLLVVQTNNASFGRKGESEQQLAMTRLRAVEHGRAAVQVSTSGESAVVAPDGTIVAASGLYEAAVLSAELALRTSPTVADRVGAAPEAVLAVVGLLAIMAGCRTGRRARPGAPRAASRPVASEVGDQEGSGVDGQRVVVCMPTYNERENLLETAGRLRAANPDVDLLVIDDASPDGTGEIADELAARDGRVHVLHRSGKSGLGTAYVAGFGWALRHGYDVIVEMDADGSHQPEELPRLLAALATADLVIGSRWVEGGRVHNWPRRRLLLSRGANAYTRAALGMPLKDATAGYRAYRASVLADRDLDGVASQGYCFQVDLAWQAWRAGFSVVEVPITFADRERGASKMSRTIVAEALWRVSWWALSTRFRRPPTRQVPVAGQTPADDAPAGGGLRGADPAAAGAAVTPAPAQAPAPAAETASTASPANR